MGRKQISARQNIDSPLRVDPRNPKSATVPEKPCAACGKPFQPTIRRRMLCAICFRSDGQQTPWLTL